MSCYFFFFLSLTCFLGWLANGCFLLYVASAPTVNTISISTDRDFEYSKNGEETYVVGGDDSEGNVEGVPGADVAEKINLFVTIFSLLNTQDAWMLRKNVLDHNLGDQISEQSLCINRSEQAV